MMELTAVSFVQNNGWSVLSVLQVTADGSVDCANEPAEQEAKVAPLHYAEVITALHILAPGGSTVVKMFTLLNHSSICVMYLLCCLFKKVCIFSICFLGRFNKK